MRRQSVYVLVLLAMCIGSTALWRVLEARRASQLSFPNSSRTWDPESAARYLDSREVWWQKWPPAQMDHGTVCISCHTVVPYTLVRPDLRNELRQKEMTPPEQAILASIEKRVTDWSEITPFYTDAIDGPGKTEQSHATEAVLNAVILSSYDASQGHLRSLTRLAFNEAWALQEKTGTDAGGWKWQDFHLAPWESPESAYQGAALFAVALGNAPDHYASDSADREQVELLKDYLRRDYAVQPMMSQLYVLWASAQMPGLLAEPDRAKLIEKIDDLQLHDGGWALASLDQRPGLRHYLVNHWRQISGTTESDGCATGLVVLALEEKGVKQEDPALNRGLQWLEHHQRKDGSWWAISLNGPRDPNTDIGRFMTDAATGYATLALEDAPRDNSTSH